MSQHSASAKQAVSFTDEQNEAIRKGFESLERNGGMTAEEAVALARKRTEAWMRANEQPARA